MLAGELGERQVELLRLFAQTTTASLASRLKNGIAVEDCWEVFSGAGAMLALAALKRMEDGVREFKAGDLTVKAGSGQDEAARCLEERAMELMGPYLQDGFSFVGV